MQFSRTGLPYSAIVDRPALEACRMARRMAGLDHCQCRGTGYLAAHAGRSRSAAGPWAFPCCQTCPTGRGTNTACGSASGAFVDGLGGSRDSFRTMAITRTRLRRIIRALPKRAELDWEFMGHGLSAGADAHKALTTSRSKIDRAVAAIEKFVRKKVARAGSRGLRQKPSRPSTSCGVAGVELRRGLGA